MHVETHTFPVPYLVSLQGDHDDHLEGLALPERHVMGLVLRTPGSILKAVENHLVPTVKSWVEVDCDVSSLKLPTLQIQREPVG